MLINLEWEIIITEPKKEAHLPWNREDFCEECEVWRITDGCEKCLYNILLEYKPRRIYNDYYDD